MIENADASVDVTYKAMSSKKREKNVDVFFTSSIQRILWLFMKKKKPSVPSDVLA